jgi:hypothetical protein
MDGSPASISPYELYSRIGTGAAALIYVWGEEAFVAGSSLIVSAVRHRPDDILTWVRDLPSRPASNPGTKGRVS